MAKILYVEKKFTAGTLAIIEKADEIIEQYTAQGYVLTLRQLYYQFVARGIIANKQKEYNRLASIVNDGRLAGLLDWAAIEDRTRNVRDLSHWNDPSDIIKTCATAFNVDLWATQKTRVEVWIEKDALVGVIEDVCEEYDVPFFSCRGYVSQSEMHSAAIRVVQRAKLRPANPQRTIVLHFGDHDPSGLDMTRDIESRVRMFASKYGCAKFFEMRRLALSMDQIRQYNPPPNPAKVTDARFVGYQAEYGDESWELDALEPSVISTLVREELDDIIDAGPFERRRREQATHRRRLAKVSHYWPDMVEHVETLDDIDDEPEADEDE